MQPPTLTPLVVTIPRSRWLFGDGASPLLSVQPGLLMCAAGFAGEAGGIPHEAMRGVETLHSAIEGQRYNDFHPALKRLLGDQDLCWHLYCLNDDTRMLAADRESEIIEAGLTAGIRFVFVDGEDQEGACSAKT